MKPSLTLLPLLLVPCAFADPYIEVKNELKYRDSLYEQAINHIRIGYKGKRNFYVEAGPRTDGTSAELGYKFNKGNFTFKGKWEGSKTEDLKHKVETEVRYTFKKS